MDSTQLVRNLKRIALYGGIGAAFLVAAFVSKWLLMAGAAVAVLIWWYIRKNKLNRGNEDFIE